MLGWVAHCSIIHYPAQLSSPRCTAPSWHDLLDYHLQPTLNFSTVKLDFKILHWFPSCLCYCCLVLLNAIIVTFFWQPSLYTNTIWSFSWRREGGAECHGRPDGVLALNIRRSHLLLTQIKPLKLNRIWIAFENSSKFCRIDIPSIIQHDKVLQSTA